MKHTPYGDNTGLTTNELVCALMGRVDANNSLFSLLAIMVEMSDGMSVKKQCPMAGSLRDAARMIEQRPKVRVLVDLLELMPTTYEARPAP